MDIIHLFIAPLIVLLFSAFFSGMEIAFVSSNKLRAEMDRADNSLTSRILDVFYKHPNNFISTLLVGNNISLVIYGLCMADLIATLITKPCQLTDMESLALAIETVISTLIVLFMGEFLPKTIFKLNPNGMLRAFALPMMLIYIILYPVSKFTSGISKCMLRIFGIRIAKADTDKAFTKLDLDHLIQSNIDEVKDAKEIDNEVKIFQNALDFSNVKVRDCIVPRTEIDAVATDSTLQHVRNHFIETGHSKILVYREDIDDIIGFVHSSEMFRLKEGDAWIDHIRETPIVPETMPAQKLLKLFMQQKRSVAVVVDEFGGTSGMVTMEDLVEEIFGEIEDEHDTNSYIAKDLGNHEYLISARLEIEKANQLLGINLPESEEYLTVGGLILSRYQSFPKLNEVVAFDNLEFKIIKNTTTKIEIVRLKVKE